jgi:hypothetical protein
VPIGGEDGVEIVVAWLAHAFDAAMSYSLTPTGFGVGGAGRGAGGVAVLHMLPEVALGLDQRGGIGVVQIVAEHHPIAIALEHGQPCGRSFVTRQPCVSCGT